MADNIEIEVDPLVESAELVADSPAIAEVAAAGKIIDDSVFGDVYKQVSVQITALVEHGSLNFGNLDELYKDVMEAVEAVRNHHVISSTQKVSMAQGVIHAVLDDVYAHGKMTKEFYDKATQLVDDFGPLIFKLVVMASKGQVHINNAIEAIGESECCQNCQKKCCIL